MIRFFPLLLILQAFCIYHAYTNKAEQKWFWIIMFLPLLGSGIYLYHHFYSRDNIAVIQESVKGAINSNYRIQQLEKQVEFSNSVMNRINLADAYVDYERYDDAMALYESCLMNFNAGSAELSMKLVNCYHYTNQHQKAVDYGIKIENEKIFKKSVERIAFAWSLYHVKDYDRAEMNFKAMNSRYSNYTHRLEYSKFLKELDRMDDSKEVLEDMLYEFDKMNSAELRPWRAEQRMVQAMHNEL